MAELTPFQTVGPYFALIVPEPGRLPAGAADRPARRITIEGTMTDGAGGPVSDGLIETWRIDPRGTDHRCSRIPTDDHGRFVIDTVMPGPIPGPDGRPQAPHLVLGVLARGILTRLASRIYFEGEPANAQDPVLALVPVERRSRLIARRADADRYQFDIVLQGTHETVFFDV
jgi:protocatechuate 3,4-dioxygenase, alpha subunit